MARRGTGRNQILGDRNVGFWICRVDNRKACHGLYAAAERLKKNYAPVAQAGICVKRKRRSSMLGCKRYGLNGDEIRVGPDQAPADLRIRKLRADGLVCVLKIEKSLRGGAIACECFESCGCCLRSRVQKVKTRSRDTAVG